MPSDHTTHLPFTVSPLLHQLITLQNAARVAIAALTTASLQDLRTYYNHALLSRRAVVTDVETETWESDLASSLAAVLFARQRAEARLIPPDHAHSIFSALIETLLTDVTQPWFQYALRNARRPTMIAMPSLPALNLGLEEERFYVQGVSDSWPDKHVSTLRGSVIDVNSRASRRFVDNMVAGDLGGVELHLTEHEKSFVQQHSIGWITRYETVARTVTIIEIDPWASGELCTDERARRAAHELVKVNEQRLNDYSLTMKLHEDESFADNLVLSRLLTIDQMLSPIHATKEQIDVGEYIHVNGSLREGLGPVDEEVFLKSLGSMTAKNKVRSALAISAKARLGALGAHGMLIRDITWDAQPKLKSMMVRCGVDGIYVKTRVPIDSVLVLAAAVVLSVLGWKAIVDTNGFSNVGEATSLALALTLGVGLTYHNLRYKSWPIGETVRLRRLCVSDEEMSLCMRKQEVISTIAEAGSKGAGMDGILTCPFSDSQAGKFSVTKPLDLESGSKVGLKLRLSTALTPLWVDLKGVRAVEEKEIWHACGSYIEQSYLQLTKTGPELIGGVDHNVMDLS